ncbi:MAG: tail fiber protein [Sphingopyxis sp.]|uniref:phage tail protein n=1 Tax=Sphingopyxis sp. TaxID=1908224 RepID=UPI002ABAA636|nr:tail fiber protein [Sphingopyxis sp.]MDZ3832820.1 tail fiber protein [Sphingopyxis sp.]
MSDQFVGEIRWFTYVRGAPAGWQLCNGALLPIAENEALYTLIGTTYGGDGRTTFAVPDLRGRIPLHQGVGPGLSPHPIGGKSGSETVTLTASQLGGHTHLIEASSLGATSSNPTSNVPATLPAGDALYQSGTSGAVPTTVPCVGNTGSGLPHENCAPTLALLPCIAIYGIFPSQG